VKFQISNLRSLLGALLTTAIACAGQSQQPATSPATLGVGPITYFEDHCARCHGSYGSGYLPESLSRRDDESLRRIIRDMSAGPAQAPLADADVDAQVAYHRSLLARVPFIATTQRTADKLAGEATAGSTLEIDVNGKRTEIPLDGHEWSVSIDVASVRSARIIATRDGKQTVLPATQPYSDPLDSNSAR
jgi:mono/diheme cytochrome c family protein